MTRSKLQTIGIFLIAAPVVSAVYPLLTLLFGAVAGLIGGLIFPQVFDNLSQLVFGKAVPAWQIGAMLGFVGGFLRAAVSHKP
ncbi:hypothetical protein WAB17_04675 [Parerythrobacter aurantius]|uniref:hypothetical protein n=1 Tax=Parerythrobacter aurantius TaxID=3127706 RepID=UPI0032481180